MTRSLYIVGAGGHGREIAWLARQSFGKEKTLRFLVERNFHHHDESNGMPISILEEEMFAPGAEYVVAIGDSEVRRRLAGILTARGLGAARLVHPQVEISPWVEIGAGSIICVNCVVTTNISIGEHVHINAGSSLHHDTVVGSYTTISPGVRVAGNVQIGQSVFIGMGANIINGTPERPLVIGDGAIVAAGSCVTRSVGAGELVAGVPAVRKR